METKLIEDIRRLCRLVNEPDCARPESPRSVFVKCLDKLEKRATEIQLLTHENVCEESGWNWENGGVIGFDVKMKTPVYFAAYDKVISK